MGQRTQLLCQRQGEHWVLAKGTRAAAGPREPSALAGARAGRGRRLSLALSALQECLALARCAKAEQGALSSSPLHALVAGSAAGAKEPEREPRGAPLALQLFLGHLAERGRLFGASLRGASLLSSSAWSGSAERRAPPARELSLQARALRR